MRASVINEGGTATYVLVHGGGHGGWCYQRVARMLQSAGHAVYAPTLTGLGERSHLVGPQVGRVKVHEPANPVGGAVGRAGDDHAAVAVTDQDHLAPTSTPATTS